MRNSLHLAFCLGLLGPAASFAEPISFIQGKDRVEVEAGSQPFTTLWTQSYHTPILWPVAGPGGIRMTRDFPIRKGTAGEEQDHPHHKGIFIGHQGTNGADFWHDHKTNSGTIEVVRRDGVGDLLQLHNHWKTPDGTRIADERRVLIFSTGPGRRAIEVRMDITAVNGPLEFEAWKDGFVAIRTHPHLRITGKPNQGIVAHGQAVNSNGITGKAIWGKRADWLHYYGPVEGKHAGIVFMSHPDNVRHGQDGAWWHARDYGLISCNPFAPKKIGGDGALTLPEGEVLTLRYRWVFHNLPADEADPAGWFKAWVGE